MFEFRRAVIVFQKQDIFHWSMISCDFALRHRVVQFAARIVNYHVITIMLQCFGYKASWTAFVSAEKTCPELLSRYIQNWWLDPGTSGYDKRLIPKCNTPVCPWQAPVATDRAFTGRSLPPALSSRMVSHSNTVGVGGTDLPIHHSPFPDTAGTSRKTNCDWYTVQ